MEGFEAESWIIERGDEIIQKREISGLNALEPIERLILHVWYTDYCMRNAGDLANLEDLCSGCLSKGVAAAEALQLPKTRAFFARPTNELERHFFDDFNGVVNELAQSDGNTN